MALEESTQQLFVGEDQELIQLLVAGLLEVLRQEQESVLVRFQHLLVFGLSIHNINMIVWMEREYVCLLQKFAHDFSHYDFVLLDFIITFVL